MSTYEQNKLFLCKIFKEYKEEMIELKTLNKTKEPDGILDLTGMEKEDNSM